MILNLSFTQLGKYIIKTLGEVNYCCFLVVSTISTYFSTFLFPFCGSYPQLIFFKHLSSLTAVIGVDEAWECAQDDCADQHERHEQPQPRHIHYHVCAS